jgi:hypothetical protein
MNAVTYELRSYWQEIDSLPTTYISHFLFLAITALNKRWTERVHVCLFVVIRLLLPRPQFPFLIEQEIKKGEERGDWGSQGRRERDKGCGRCN